MFKAAERLREFATSITGESPAAAHLDIFRQTRLLLEAHHLKADYLTISFYCDWYVHVALDRHEAGIALLEFIGSLCQSDTHPIVAMRQELGLSKLREELFALFSRCCISTYILCDDQRWFWYSQLLLQQVSSKPISWPAKPNGKTKEALIRTKAKMPRQDLLPNNFFMEHKPDGYEGSGFYWTVELKRDGPYVAAFMGQILKDL